MLLWLWHIASLAPFLAPLIAEGQEIEEVLVVPSARAKVETFPIFKNLRWNKVLVEKIFYEGPDPLDYVVEFVAQDKIELGGLTFPKGVHVVASNPIFRVRDFKDLWVNGIKVCDLIGMHSMSLEVVEIQPCDDVTIRGIKIPQGSLVAFLKKKLQPGEKWLEIYCINPSKTMTYQGTVFEKGSTLFPGAGGKKGELSISCLIEEWKDAPQPVPIDDDAKKAIAKFPIFKEMDWSKTNFEAAVFEGPEKRDYFIEFSIGDLVRIGGREVDGGWIKGQGLSYRAFSIGETKIGQWKICERFGQNAQTLQIFEAEFCQEIPLPEGKIPARSVLSFVNGLPEGNIALKDIACIIPSQALTLNGININAGQAAEIKDGQVSFPKKPCIPLRDQIYYKKRDPWDPK